MKLAVIPARGGSKRIPGKNIKPFAGKPMIAYSVEAALKSQCFDRVIVSTDDEEIKSIAESYGAEVPFMRPAEISDDYSTTSAVIQHAIAWQSQNGISPEFVCCIYATAPFVQVESLQQGLALLQSSGCEYVFSATSFAFPIQRAIKLDKKNKVSMFYPQYLNTRSQDLEDAYHDAGQFYWGRASAFANDLPIFAETSRIVKLPRALVQDIDTPEDWEHAELLFHVLSQQTKR